MTDRLEIGVLPQLAEMKSADEDWSGISAAASRRRLQNRLNQRARRKRAKKESSIETVPGRTRKDKSTSEDGDEPAQNTATLPCGLSNTVTRQELVKFADVALSRYSMGIANPVHLPDVLRFNIFHAFAMNAISLSLTDAWLEYDAISVFGSQLFSTVKDSHRSYPRSLEPTILQYKVEHHPWIDLLPCPTLRDNFLGIVQEYGEDAIDEDKLCQDIIDAGTRDPEANTAALIVWGDPWEVASWEATEDFVQNWGCLLYGCSELLKSTNAWREKRGLPHLSARQEYPFFEKSTTGKGLRMETVFSDYNKTY